MAKPLHETKAFSILHFIGQGGRYGRKFTEIQEFIVRHNGLDWDARSPNFPWAPSLRDYDKQTRRRYRGYYCTILLGGMHYHQGLLWTYCVKLPNGRWILTEDIYSRTNLNYQHGDERANTLTWQFNETLKRGIQEEWRDARGDSDRPWDGKNNV